MKIAIVIPPSEFRDETVGKAKKLFERWNVEAVIAGFTSKECIGSHGASYTVQANAAKLPSGDFDAVLLADGLGVDRYKLYEIMPLLEGIRTLYNSNKIIACVNNSIKIAARANIITNLKVSVPKEPDAERLVRLYRGLISENDMECAANPMSLNDWTKMEEFAGALLDRLGVR